MLSYWPLEAGNYKLLVLAGEKNPYQEARGKTAHLQI